MKTRDVVFRFLFLLLTVVVLADTVFCLALLRQEAGHDFMWWQWETLGWILAVALSFVLGLAYSSVMIGFRASSKVSNLTANTTAFIVVLANVYSVIALWQIVEYFLSLGLNLNAWAHIFMVIHLTAVGIIALFFIAVNKKEEEKIAGPQSPDDVIELLK